MASRIGSDAPATSFLRRSRNFPLRLAPAAALALTVALVFASPAAALEQKLTASDAAALDILGSSVAIDGDTLVVGAPGETNGGNARGAVYVYQRVGASWTQTAKLTATDGANLGTSVAIDGDTIVAGDKANAVGPVGGGHGAVYTFARTGAADRTETAKLTASDAYAAEYLGTSVAIDGDTIVAGAPSTPSAGRARRRHLRSGLGLHLRPHGRGRPHRDREADRLRRCLRRPARHLRRDRRRHDRRGGALDNAANANEGSVYTFTRTGAQPATRPRS